MYFPRLGSCIFPVSNVLFPLTGLNKKFPENYSGIECKGKGEEFVGECDPGAIF